MESAPEVARDTRNILLAEASSVTRLMVKAILQHAGHRVVAVPALDLRVRSVHAHYGASGAYDLLIVGSGPAGEHPAAILEGVRSLFPPQPCVPVICLPPSGANRSSHDLSMFDGVIERPIDPRQCVALVSDVEAAPLAQSELDGDHNTAVEDDDPAASSQSVADCKDAPAGVAGPQLVSSQESHDADAGLRTPSFQTGATCQFDENAMQDLVELGGADFAAEIVDQFVTDGARLLKDISSAVAASDGASFREHAHALRSCAANVGARGIYNLCMEWRQASSSQISADGAEYSRELEREFFAIAEMLRGRYGAQTAGGADDIAAVG
ncbi:MAG: Hpt domain-containing protein [Hyphomicrobiales bacterium]|nr:Hpt domain-containing protein [Hyphomicrobiales bacterium]